MIDLVSLSWLGCSNHQPSQKKPVMAGYLSEILNHFSKYLFPFFNLTNELMIILHGKKLRTLESKIPVKMLLLLLVEIFLPNHDEILQINCYKLITEG